MPPALGPAIRWRLLERLETNVEDLFQNNAFCAELRESIEQHAAGGPVPAAHTQVAQQAGVLRLVPAGFAAVLDALEAQGTASLDAIRAAVDGALDALVEGRTLLATGSAADAAALRPLLQALRGPLAHLGAPLSALSALHAGGNAAVAACIATAALAALAEARARPDDASAQGQLAAAAVVLGLDPNSLAPIELRPGAVALREWDAAVDALSARLLERVPWGEEQAADLRREVQLRACAAEPAIALVLAELDARRAEARASAERAGGRLHAVVQIEERLAGAPEAVERICTAASNQSAALACSCMYEVLGLPPGAGLRVAVERQGPAEGALSNLALASQLVRLEALLAHRPIDAAVHVDVHVHRVVAVLDTWGVIAGGGHGATDVLAKISTRLAALSITRGGVGQPAALTDVYSGRCAACGAEPTAQNQACAHLVFSQLPGSLDDARLRGMVPPGLCAWVQLLSSGGVQARTARAVDQRAARMREGAQHASAMLQAIAARKRLANGGGGGGGGGGGEDGGGGDSYPADMLSTVIIDTQVDAHRFGLPLVQASLTCQGLLLCHSTVAMYDMPFGPPQIRGPRHVETTHQFMEPLVLSAGACLEWGNRQDGVDGGISAALNACAGQDPTFNLGSSPLFAEADAAINGMLSWQAPSLERAVAWINPDLLDDGAAAGAAEGPVAGEAAAAADAGAGQGAPYVEQQADAGLLGGADPGAQPAAGADAGPHRWPGRAGDAAIAADDNDADGGPLPSAVNCLGATACDQAGGLLARAYTQARGVDLAGIPANDYERLVPLAAAMQREMIAAGFAELAQRLKMPDSTISACLAIQRDAEAAARQAGVAAAAAAEAAARRA